MKHFPRQISSNDDLTVGNLNLILFGHSAFQYLNAGCELKIFELLHDHANHTQTKQSIQEATGLNTQSTDCLILGLTSLGLIFKSNGYFHNAMVIENFFEQDLWETFKDVVLFESKITYLGQYDFVESLKSGNNEGLKRIPGKGEDLYHKLSENPELQQVFYKYMSSWSKMSITLLLDSFDFSEIGTILDVGGGDATTAIAIANRFKKVKIEILELPENSGVTRANIQSHSLTDTISVIDGNMFSMDFHRKYDCILFIHQLVIWPQNKIKHLMTKALSALNENGVVIIFNSFTSDEEDGPLMGALDSVYFVSIPAKNGGMIYPFKIYEKLLLEAGFKRTQRIQHSSWSPHGTLIAYKN